MATARTVCCCPDYPLTGEGRSNTLWERVSPTTDTGASYDVFGDTRPSLPPDGMEVFGIFA